VMVIVLEMRMQQTAATDPEIPITDW